MVCKAARESSKMRLRLERWLSQSGTSLILVVDSRVRGGRK